MNSKQLFSSILSLAIMGNVFPVNNAQAVYNQTTQNLQNAKIVKLDNSKGEIVLTVNFALPQTKAEVISRNIELSLESNGVSSVVNLSTGDITGSLLSSEQVSISPLETNEYFGSYNIVLSNLNVGQYGLELSGDGYTNISEQIDLSDYSKHIILSTDNGAFAVGDFNNDGVVDILDQMNIQNALGSTNQADIDVYDLDGDNKIDITDLSYVNKNKNIIASAVIKDTALISQVTVDVNDIQVADDANIEDIFEPNNETPIKISSNDNVVPTVDTPIVLPVILSDSDEGVELSEIKITTPVTEGAIKDGYVTVEFTDGSVKDIPFSQIADEANLVRASIDNVITINLGQKVAIKKVTIKVTAVEGDVGYATVSQVEFLKEVNVTTEDTSIVKNLSASAGDESVKLGWSSVNNVTGYRIFYGTDKNNMNVSMNVVANNATISGLENDVTYYFKVVATNGDWTGTESSIVSATPISYEIPGKPSNIQIQPADSSLRVSWSKTKNALSYQVYYREQGSDEFIKFGNDITSTNAIITGLTNDVTYEIAIKAGNKMGYGPYSDVALGTPKMEGFKLPELPTEDRIDNSEISIKMADSGNVDWGLCPNFNVNHLIDNNANTYWIAKNYWYNSNITYTFDTPQDMNYALLVPYLDNNYKNRIDTYDIIARDDEGNIVSEVHNRQATLTSKGYIILTFPQAENVKSLTIALGEKVGGPRVSVSEMAFYKSSTLADDIANLFADDAFTQLKDDIQLSDIEALEQKLNQTSNYYMDIERLRDEIILAKSLLTENPDLGVVKSDFMSRSANNDVSVYGQSASNFQPIGVSARANTTIAVYAEIPEDEDVYLVPTQYYGESGVWKGSPVRLENGRNYITVQQIGNLADTRGGALYLTYSGDKADEIKIHVRGNSESTFATPILDLSNWYNMSEQDRKTIITNYISELKTYVSDMNVNSDASRWVKNATEIATPSILLSMPADQILRGLQAASSSGATGVQSIYDNVFSILSATDDISAMTEAMYQNILAWEEEMYVANMVQGIIPADTEFKNYQYPMETRQNIRYMRMFAGAFMYAAGEHIGVEYGSCAPLVQGKPTDMTSGQAENGLFGWGIAHEIGHNMDKIGYAEITNNIYSMAMQAWDGSNMTTHTTRLTTDGRWSKIFDKTAQAREGMANDVFVQLGMYWQLHLAYDDAENPLAFYNQLFDKLKDGAYSDYTRDERVALIASEIAQKDLSEFFTHWGVKLSQNVLDIMDEYVDEERAIWYLSDESRNARLDGIGENNFDTIVTTNVDENVVTLTMSNDDESTIQGYEIIRNGVTIGFTMTNTYTDNLGAANNLAYTYQVVPIDILGNVGDIVEVDEVRISYDKVIDPSLYTLTRDVDGNIIITMKNGEVVPVTGLKITGADGSVIDVGIKTTVDNAETEVVPEEPEEELPENTPDEELPEKNPDESEEELPESGEISPDENEGDLDNDLPVDGDGEDGVVDGSEIPSEDDTTVEVPEEEQSESSSNVEEDLNSEDVVENGDIIVEQQELQVINLAERTRGLRLYNQTDIVNNVYDMTEDTDITDVAVEWTVAKNDALVTGDNYVMYFNKPGVDSSDTRIWTYDVGTMKISGIPEDATVELLDYPGDKVDFYEGSTVGVLAKDYQYGPNSEDVITANTLVIIGTYRGDPAYNYVEVEAIYNTTPEAGEVTTIKRAMNGYTLMFAEIPEDGAVSDTSDGFFIFVPDLEAEEALNSAAGVTDKLPLEIKLKMYRSDSVETTDSKRLTSETLWLSFPDEETLPQIEFTKGETNE